MTLHNRILLIEDSEINRCLLQDFLESQGYTICGLPDGSTFFETIEQFNPHIILLDLKLPDVDGFTLLEQLQHSVYSSIPVVVISAYGFEREKRRAFSLGARSYLRKPTALEEIIKAIELAFTHSVAVAPTEPPVH